jgi:predicted dehydrogenase
VAGEERREIPVEASDRYRLEIEDFADAILEGREPMFKMSETQRNMEVLDTLFAASVGSKSKVPGGSSIL